MTLGGLTAGQVAARRVAGETNDQPSKTSRTVADIVKANVLTRLNLLLGSLFVVMLVVGSVKDALFAVLVVANDGAIVETPAEEIVRGDDGLRTQKQVVADGRVLIANCAEIDEIEEIDESILTESVPVAARPGETVRSGTVGVAGSGWFPADAVGADPNRLATQAKSFQPGVSELQQSIAQGPGVPRLHFPYLPRHLTLISGLTIAMPGVFLAFSPTEDHNRPGFLRGVVAFAGPAVVAAPVFGAYAGALTEQDLDIRQARNSATLVILALGSWIVVLLARPLTAWRTALLGVLATLTAAILALPAGRHFYDSASPPPPCC